MNQFTKPVFVDLRLLEEVPDRRERSLSGCDDFFWMSMPGSAEVCESWEGDATKQGLGLRGASVPGAFNPRPPMSAEQGVLPLCSAIAADLAGGFMSLRVRGRVFEGCSSLLEPGPFCGGGCTSLRVRGRGLEGCSSLLEPGNRCCHCMSLRVRGREGGCCTSLHARWRGFTAGGMSLWVRGRRVRLVHLRILMTFCSLGGLTLLIARGLGGSGSCSSCTGGGLRLGIQRGL